MTKCIGIISYLPDDNKLRNIRLFKLNGLLKRCDELFNLPIIIIAQNWKETELVRISNKIIIYSFNKPLGITGARRELRKRFLQLGYDYLIMLDDDIVLVGTQPSADRYLKQIEENPQKFGTFKALTLQLFAISKEMFSLIDYPDGEIVNGDFFEDMWLIMALKKLYPDKFFSFIKGDLDPVGNAANDENSTWYHKQFNKHNIGDRTRAMIKELNVN